MSNPPRMPRNTTLEVRGTCLCLHLQRAARAVARRFDAAFRALGLTSGQFSLLMSLNRPQPPVMREVAALLGMDRTTLTAALKSLERRRLVEIRADEADRRSRRLLLTPAGRALLATAYPVWSAAHGAIETMLGSTNAKDLRGNLARLTLGEKPAMARETRRRGGGRAT
jgi:DNA-binding MarR family transcriptional regulator